MLKSTTFVLGLLFAGASFAVEIPGATYQQNQTATQVLNAASQIGGWLGLGPKGDYLEPGRPIVMPNGIRANVYGSDCRPGEAKPCRSVKVSDTSTRVTVIPEKGQPFEEYWRVQRLNDNRLAIRRQNGQMIVTP